jgi:hypothetical protein
MEITIDRLKIVGHSTVSKISVDGIHAYYRLENVCREIKTTEKTCIPAGIYKIKTTEKTCIPAGIYKIKTIGFDGMRNL